jgi:predicted negative regulator of RcsB-dependent stress response
MALDELLDEHEQSERVRDWLRHNALGIIGGVVLGLGAVGGFKWWQAQAHEARVQSGETYQSVLDSLKAGDLKKAQAQAAGLKEGAFAALVALDLAKAQLDAGQRDAAIATLRGVTTSDPGLSLVLRQRLARLLIDAGKGQEALQLLADAEDPLGLEARGDAQLALGKRDEARKAYADALTKLDVAAPRRRLLELKLTDAG